MNTVAQAETVRVQEARQAEAQSVRTPAQVEASRLNGAKSRGPATAEGKERSRCNALKHGLAAERVAILGESAEAFKEYRQAFYDDLRPAGTLEAALVGRIAAANWRLQRALEMEQGVFSDDRYLAHHKECEWDGRKPSGPLDPWPTPRFTAMGRTLKESMSGPNCSMDTLGRYERRIERGLFQAVNELKKLQKERGAWRAEPRGEERGARGEEDAETRRHRDAEKEAQMREALFSREPQASACLAQVQVILNSTDSETVTPEQEGPQNREAQTQAAAECASQILTGTDSQVRANTDAQVPAAAHETRRDSATAPMMTTALAALAPDGAKRDTAGGRQEGATA